MDKEANAIPSMFKDEKQALIFVGKFLDFTNADIRNAETGARVNFINTMLQENFAGAKEAFWNDDPKYGEAYDFISNTSLALGQGREYNFSTPSFPDAQVLSVYHPGMKRKILQLNLGELTKQDFKTSPGDQTSPHLHPNEHYARWDNETRLRLANKGRLEVAEEKSRKTPSSSYSKPFARTVMNFAENKKSPGLLSRLLTGNLFNKKKKTHKPVGSK